MTGADSSHRHPLLRKLSLLLFGMILLLAAFVLYLHTRHAFRHFIIPLVAAGVPGELRVDDGFLSFPATLELAGLSYRQPMMGLSLQIDQLHVRISVMAWLRDHLLLVEELDLKDGHLQMTSGETPPQQEGETTATSAGKTAVMVPFAVQRARLENITLSIQADRDEFTVRNMKMAIDDIGPGRTGTIDLRSEVTVTYSAGQSRWAGVLLLTGTLEESPGGQQLKWNVSTTLKVRAWPGSVAVADSGAITLVQTISGYCDFAQATVHADSSLTLRQDETSLSDVSLTFTRTESPDGTVMDGGMKIHELTDEGLNLLLGLDGSIHLRSAHMSGSVEIHASGERYDVRSIFTGQKLQAVSREGTTPPLDVDVAQTGRFDIGSRNATLDIFELRVAERDHVWLAGELNHSLTINLATDGMELKGVSTRNTPQADWKLMVNDIGVAELRRWCEAFGWKGLQGVHEGRLDGTVTLSSRDNGNAIDLNSRLMISNVRTAGAVKRIARARLKFDHEIHGTITNLTMLQVRSWILTASVNARPVGALRLSGTMNLRTPARDPRLEGSLTLTDLPGEVCNPLLALWSDARIDRALLNGTAEIKMTGDLLSWEINLRGNQVTLRLPGVNNATAPLELLVAQSGSFDRTTGVLQLDKGILQEFARSRPVITAALDKPVRFAIPGKGTDEKTPRAPDGQAATFTVEAHHLGVGQLRAHLAVWRISALDGVKTGIVDGRWIAQWQGGTGLLSVTGTLDVADLRLDAGTIHIRAPLGLRSRTNAAITEFSRIRVKALNVEARAGARLIVEAGVSGQANVDDGSTDLAVRVKTDRLAVLLDRIGLLDERQRTVFTGGRVSAEGRLGRRGRQYPLSAQTTIHARELRVQPLQGQLLTYSFHTEGSAELNVARTGIAFNKLGMTLQSQGKAAGILTLAGTWPIAPSELDGAITIVTKDLDVAPLVDVFGLFPGREQGPLPVSANVAIALDSARGSLAVRGQETIGPIRLARNRNEGGPNEATLHIEHDLSRHHDEIRATALTLTADRPGGLADRVTASGTVRIAGRPGAKLRGDIASLDAAWYAALFSGPEARKRPTDTNQSNALALLTNLDAEMSIASVSYRTLTIGPGRVIAKGTGEQLEAKLESTGMADGRVEAIVTLAPQDKHPQLTWSGKGQGLSVATIDQAVEAGQIPSLNGIGSFLTSGHVLLNEGPFRKHLTGIIDFKIEDGQFLRSPMLQFLSNYTRISELEHMGFDSFQGNVRLEGNWIHADSLTVTGSLASLQGNVTVSPDDIADGRIFVKIGPSLAKKIKIPCMSALLQTSDGFTALPFAVRIKGPTESPTFSADTEAWNYAKGSTTSLADTMKNLLRGCREERPEEQTQ